MHSFIKAQASSITASAADFGTTVLLKEVFHVWYLKASITGTIVGGIVNFIINRNWVFNTGRKVSTDEGNTHELGLEKEKAHHLSVHIVRYVLVWAGNLILNAAGVYLLTHYGGVSYMISKSFVALLVGFTYNYLLQKRFVFSKG